MAAQPLCNHAEFDDYLYWIQIGIVSNDGGIKGAGRKVRTA